MWQNTRIKNTEVISKDANKQANKQAKTRRRREHDTANHHATQFREVGGGAGRRMRLGRRRERRPGERGLRLVASRVGAGRPRPRRHVGVERELPHVVRAGRAADRHVVVQRHRLRHPAHRRAFELGIDELPCAESARGRQLVRTTRRR